MIVSHITRGNNYWREELKNTDVEQVIRCNVLELITTPPIPPLINLRELACIINGISKIRACQFELLKTAN